MIRREGTERLSSEGATGSRPYTGISVRVGRTFSEPRRESTTQGLEREAGFCSLETGEGRGDGRGREEAREEKEGGRLFSQK